MTKSKLFSKRQKGILYAVLSSFLFSLSFLATEIMALTIDAFDMLAWRFLFAYAGYSILMMVLGKSNTVYKKPSFLLKFSSLLLPIGYYIFETNAIHFTSAAHTGIILACVPMATLLFSFIMLNIKPKFYQLIGIALSMIGVFLNTVLSKAWRSDEAVLSHNHAGSIH